MSGETGDTGLVPTTQEQKHTNENAPSPIGIVEALKKENTPFKHELFRQRIREMKGKVMQTGDITFIPLMWGMPKTDASELLATDTLIIQYDPDNLQSLPLNTLRPSEHNKVDMGMMGAFDDLSTEINPLTVKDVATRVDLVNSFADFILPHKPNKFNQLGGNGLSSLTDAHGQLYVSLNCPEPLAPRQGSSMTLDPSVPYVGYLTMETKLFYAAYLAEMGYDSDVVYHAVGEQPRSSNGVGAYETDADEIQTSLAGVPSLAEHFKLRGQYTPPAGDSRDAKQTYRDILTSARFNEKGNVTFRTKPPVATITSGKN